MPSKTQVIQELVGAVDTDHEPLIVILVWKEPPQLNKLKDEPRKYAHQCNKFLFRGWHLKDVNKPWLQAEWGQTLFFCQCEQET